MNHRSRSDLIPLPNWTTNVTLNNNRAGNAVKCQRSLFSDSNIGSSFGSSMTNTFGYAPLKRPYGPRDMEDLRHEFILKQQGRRRRSGFGKMPSLRQSEGPNNVSYRKPFNTYRYGPGGNTINYLKSNGYNGPLKDSYLPQSREIYRVQKNYNPTGWLADYSTNNYESPYVKPQRRIRWPKQDMMDDIEPSASFGYPSWDASSGYLRLSQPLDLYSYQNDPYYGSYKYPEFLGPRAWYGGFGARGARKRRKKKKTIPKAGDILHVQNGEIKVQRNRNRKRNGRRRSSRRY